MIAIGIVLFVVAVFCLRYFGSKWHETKVTEGDIFWSVVAIIGIILTVAGIVIWCWKHLP